MRFLSKPVILIIALLSLSLIIAGCGDKSKDKAPGAGDPPKAAAKAKYSLATAGTGGTYYPMGGGVASVVKEAAGIEIAVETSGGSAENLRLIQSGETDMAWANASEIYWAWNGQEFFKGQNIKDFRVRHLSLGCSQGQRNQQFCRPCGQKSRNWTSGFRRSCFRGNISEGCGSLGQGPTRLPAPR